MNPKKPRGSRKPLDQSFLEFVHGTETEQALSEAFEPEALSSEENTYRLSQVEAQLTQLKQEVEQMDKNTNQPLAELKQRLDQLEKTLLDRESKHFSRVDSQLTHLTQQVTHLETHFGQVLAELQYHSPKLEEASSNQPTNHTSLVEPQSTQPTQSVELDVSHHPPAETPKRIDQGPERRSESDSLLSHIGPLLDNF